MLSQRYSSLVEAGCDEAGRGCLAGPVVAAAVIMPAAFAHPWLRDSKKLTPARRKEMREIIMRESIAWACGSVDCDEIDRINILNSSIKAMHLAIKDLEPSPEFLLIDGNRFKPYGDLPFRCFVKGDDRFTSIAAASILAKTERDSRMLELHEAFPEYGWKSNKGYPTREHREALMKIGPSPHHRKTFRLLPDQLKLF